MTKPHTKTRTNRDPREVTYTTLGILIANGPTGLTKLYYLSQGMGK
jgi:hypothetical protein